MPYFSLMDEVLEALRVSAGEIPLIKNTFNLYETIDPVINLYLAKALEKNT